MRDFLVTPSVAASSEITVPGDKSISHRALMLGAVASGNTEIDGLLVGEDCLATLGAMEAMGVTIERPSQTSAVVHGVGMDGLSAPNGDLDLGNSGTGMRLLAGLLCGQSFDSRLRGDGSLSRRPMKRIITPLTMMGARIDSHEGMPPLEIEGGHRLSGINYPLPVASAQVKSAVLLAGLYARGETVVVEPAVTRDHTERMLKTLGAVIDASDGRVRLAGQQTLTGARIEVPGDLSSAAFFIVAGLISENCELVLKNVGVNPTRTGVIEILREMGADIEVRSPRMCGEEPAADLVVRSSRLEAISLPADKVSLAIDEFPILFVAAAAAEGISRFSGLEELRVKESDRVDAMVQGLRALGVTANETAEGAEILGGDFTGGDVDSRGDHRIAMALAVAGMRASGAVRIRDVDAVDTSFPGFADLFTSVGGSLTVTGGEAS